MTDYLPRICAIALLLAQSPSSAETVTFYVSPEGRDVWSGRLRVPDRDRKDGPFATLSAAVSACRALATGTARRIVVRGGTYYNTSVVLGPEDSGLVIEAAAGEKPVLCGGMRVTGWEKDGDRFYSAPLPDVNGRPWDFSMITVNGRYAPQARLPHRGMYVHASEWPGVLLSEQSAAMEIERPIMRYRPGDLGPWLDIDNAEISIFYQWDESRRRLKSIDDLSRTVTFATPASSPPGTQSEFVPRPDLYVVWNVREGMSEPGQWYIDRKRSRLVYWPRPGETMASVEVIAPTTANIIRTVAPKDQFVSSLTLKGLSFCCATASQTDAGGFGGLLEGALEMARVADLRLERLALSCLGGNAIRLQDSKRVRITDCKITDIGGGGIYGRAGSMNVGGNLVSRVGLSYSSAAGICVYCSQLSRFHHNEISDAPYGGFHSWLNGGVVENNLVYNVMRALVDGGHYYLGIQGVRIRHNVAYGSRGPGVNAIYLDGGAAKYVVERNLAINTGTPVAIGPGERKTIRRNVFIDTWDSLPRAEPPCVGEADERVKIHLDCGADNSFIRNLVYAVPEITVGYQWAKSAVKVADNILYSKRGKVEYLNLADGGNITDDPLFIDLARPEAGFRPGSPALQLGISPLSQAMGGRKGAASRRRCLTPILRVLSVPKASEGHLPGSSRVLVSLTNEGDVPETGRLSLWVAPDDVAHVVGSPVIDYALAPGATTKREFAIVMTREANSIYAGLQLDGYPHSLRVVRVSVKREISMNRIQVSDPTLDSAAPVLSSVGWRDYYKGNDLKLRLRAMLIGNCIAVQGEVRDIEVKRPEPYTEGSHLELLFAATTPGVLRTVFLPASGDSPAAVQVFRNAEPVPEAALDWQIVPVDGGYRVDALIPLELIGMSPDAREFMFEAAVGGTPSAHALPGRSTCYGSSRLWTAPVCKVRIQ